MHVAICPMYEYTVFLYHIEPSQNKLNKIAITHKSEATKRRLSLRNDKKKTNVQRNVNE